MARSLLDEIVLVGAGGAVLFQAISVLRFAVLHLRRYRGTDLAQRNSMCYEIRAAIIAFMAFVFDRPPEERDTFRELVAKKMRFKRIQLMTTSIFYFTNASAVFMLGLVYLKIVGRRPWTSLTQDILLLLLFVICTLCIERPSTIRKVGVSFSYSFFMVVHLVWVLCATFHRPAFAFSSTVSVGPRLMLSVSVLHSTPVIFWNVIHFVAHTFFFASMSKGNCGCLTPNRVIFFEIYATLLVVASSEGFRRLIIADVKREIETTETKSGSLAAVALLNTVCDASVELTEDLRIADDAPRLAAMLLHGANRSLKGVDFRQLMHLSDDQEQFDWFARQWDNPLYQENAMANLFHIRLKDTAETVLKVEVFMVSFTGYCDRTRYLIGLREQATDSLIQPPPDEPVEVRFDAATFEVLWRSSSFDLRSSYGPCNPGDDLRRWFVRSLETTQFLQELGIVTAAVHFSGDSFSFSSAMVLMDLVKPGTAYMCGHRYLVKCTVRLYVEPDEFTGENTMECSTTESPSVVTRICTDRTTHEDARFHETGDGTAAVNVDEVASDSVGVADAPTRRRVIASVRTGEILRIKGRRSERTQRSRSPTQQDNSLSRSSSSSTSSSLDEVISRTLCACSRSHACRDDSSPTIQAQLVGKRLRL